MTHGPTHITICVTISLSEDVLNKMKVFKSNESGTKYNNKTVGMEKKCVIIYKRSGTQSIYRGW